MGEKETDYQWDKKLRINTAGREASHADEYHYPYEPTSYQVLSKLAESGYIDKNSRMVDYGCGKGRVGFYMNYMLGCHVTGIEYNEQIYLQAKKNQDTYAGRKGTEFLHINAEEFEVREEDCFYFFNPFSIEILRTVIGQIFTSYYNNPRKMRLFFYYPNPEYLEYLMNHRELIFIDEIDCRDIFEGKNKRERIMVFGL